MKNKELHEELKKHAPKLAKIHKEAFRPEVPENYFRELARNVLQRIDEEKTAAAPPRQHLWLIANRYAFLRLAATVMLLIVVFALYYSRTHRAQDDFAQNLTDEEIEHYISNHIDEFDEELLLVFLGTLQTREEEYSVKGSEPLEGISDEELNQYLDDILDEIDETTLESLL